MDESNDVDVLQNQVVDGSYLASSSYDGTCKLFTIGDYKPVKSFTETTKIMTCDVSGDGRNIATASYDRSFKIYGIESYLYCPGLLP